MNNLNPSLEAFSAGAGFTTNELAILIAVLGMISITAWALWVLWSVWKGFKSGKTDKTKLIITSQRVAVMWLMMNLCLMWGVTF